MIIASAEIKLYASWVASLKEKRMIVKSITEKARHKFNISVAETDAQDMHKTVVIGVCCVTNTASHANAVINEVVNFIENNTEAVVCDVAIEIF